MLEQNEKIKDKKSIVTKEVCKWVTNKKIKTLAIRSTYDTGKTTLIKKIITEFGDKFKRILFVSYRQTLTNELHGNFYELKVNSYLDGLYDSDRLICQIESLHKIMNKIYAFDNEGVDIEIPSYDLVVIDEIESVLNHFESGTIKEKKKTFDLLSDIINSSGKVLALDGDFDNRSFEYVSNILDSEEKSQYIILENEVKKNKRNYKFTNNKENFDKEIEKNLAKGKNVIIVSMSSTVADDYYQRYSKKYKCIIHTSKVDDKLKNELKNVNDFWIKYELIIYSPSVESGVNFDKEHIYKIYIILSSNSTSPRGLLQMTSRCRKVENTEILVYLNSLPYLTKVSFYKYDEIKEYVINITKDCLSRKKKIIYDNGVKKTVYRCEMNLYNKILVHNILERSNKNSKYFVAYLLKLLDQKGHTYELLDNCSKKTINKGTIMKEEIMKAEDIDEDYFTYLLKKQKSNEATREDKIMIEKHIFKKDWKTNEITEDFTEKYYGKTNVLYNLRWLIDETQIDPYIELYGKIMVDFKKAEKLEQIKIIKDLIIKLGFNSVMDTKDVPKAKFDENWNNLLIKSEFFNNKLKIEPLFGIKKNIKIGSTKAFLGFINSIFKDWGFGIILKSNSNSKKKIDGKWKTVKTQFYVLKFLDDINKYI